MTSVSVAYLTIAKLAGALGVRNIRALPGCWEHETPDGWRVSVNGHATATRTTTGLDVPPYHALVERDGTPLGLLTPDAGVLVGGPETEDALIAALERAWPKEAR